MDRNKSRHTVFTRYYSVCNRPIRSPLSAHLSVSSINGTRGLPPHHWRQGQAAHSPAERVPAEGEQVHPGRSRRDAPLH